MIPSEHPHLPAAALTHPGMSGKENEDRYGVFAFRLSETKPVPATLAVVSDGIGGHQAGEVAAELAIATIQKTVQASDGNDPLAALHQAVTQASQAIHAQAESNPRQQGMGATCACCLVIDDRLYTTNIGDSRIYLIRDGQIHQLSTDHTWVQEAIEYGLITPEEGRSHPNAHVIRRYLGSAQPPEPDFRLRLSAGESPEQARRNQGMALRPGDRLLLCSDGLTDLVNDEEILSALSSQEPQAALKQLVDLANQRGGHDNITLVTLLFPGRPPRSQARTLAPTRWKLQAFLLGMLVVFLLALIGLGAWWLLHSYGIIP